MPLATEMILVSIFAEISLVTRFADPLKRGLLRCGIRGRLRSEDFLIENFGIDWWERSNPSFEIIATGERQICSARVRKRASTYCQSLRMWVLCGSLLLKATWQLLHVKGCVDAVLAVAVSMFPMPRLTKKYEIRAERSELRLCVSGENRSDRQWPLRRFGGKCTE